MNKIIFLDPGHGGTDVGAINGSRHEADDNLRLALAVQKLLVAQGHTVIMARTTDVYISLAARTQAANSSGADIFVSLHRNSFTNSTANGTEIWVYTTAGAVDVGAATEVLEQLAAVGIQSNRGIKKGNYHVLRESNMTSMLIELGFISNVKDNNLFDAHFSDYATAIARGILAALGESYAESGQQSETVMQSLYRVQVGAFGVKSNAEAFLKSVQGMGLDAFLVEPGEAKE